MVVIGAYPDTYAVEPSIGPTLTSEMLVSMTVHRGLARSATRVLGAAQTFARTPGREAAVQLAADLKHLASSCSSYRMSVNFQEWETLQPRFQFLTRRVRGLIESTAAAGGGDVALQAALPLRYLNQCEAVAAISR